MRNIKLVLEYDGTNYMGWQKQPDATTIQGTLENAIQKLTSEKIEVIGCSRTDSRVHAKGYVCNFKTNSKIPTNKFTGALNYHLPEDIAVIDSCEVDENFHARYNSRGKMYCYTIVNTSNRRPLLRNIAYHFRGNLDVNAMREAAELLQGKHDFSAFKNMGSSVKSNIRTITDIRVEKENDYIRIYISADGFLYNMARIIVGTLVDVGNKKINLQDMKNIIDSRDRNKAGKTCPAQGLCLIDVYY